MTRKIMQMFEKIEILKRIRNDCNMLSECYPQDCEIITDVIKEINQIIKNDSIEQIMDEFSQIEDSFGNPMYEKCANCQDEKRQHDLITKKCNAFGTCKCLKFIPQSFESLQISFMPVNNIEAFQ